MDEAAGLIVDRADVGAGLDRVEAGDAPGVLKQRQRRKLAKAPVARSFDQATREIADGAGDSLGHEAVVSGDRPGVRQRADRGPRGRAHALTTRAADEAAVGERAERRGGIKPDSLEPAGEITGVAQRGDRAVRPQPVVTGRGTRVLKSSHGAAGSDKHSVTAALKAAAGQIGQRGQRAGRSHGGIASDRPGVGDREDLAGGRVIEPRRVTCDRARVGNGAREGAIIPQADAADASNPAAAAGGERADRAAVEQAHRPTARGPGDTDAGNGTAGIDVDAVGVGIDQSVDGQRGDRGARGNNALAAAPDLPAARYIERATVAHLRPADAVRDRDVSLQCCSRGEKESEA